MLGVDGFLAGTGCWVVVLDEYEAGSRSVEQY